MTVAGRGWWQRIRHGVFPVRGAPASPAPEARRVDWRFLLPSPGGDYARLALIGGAPGLDSLLLDTRTGLEVTRSLPDDSSADAAVVLADSWVSPAAVARALKPGGVVWWEVDRGRQPAMTPHRLSRLLRQAGLTVDAAYWALGGHEHCTMFMPLGSRHATLWAFGSYVSREAVRTRFLWPARVCVRFAPRWSARHLPSFLRTFSLMASAGTDGPRLPACLEVDGILPEGIRTEGVSPLMLTRGTGRVALLVFTDETADPSAVVKVQRTPKTHTRTMREWDNLRAIRPMLPDRMRRTLPEPRAEARWRGLTLTSQTFMAGDTPRGSDRSGPAQDCALRELRIASAWLRAFHESTTIQRVSVGDLLQADGERYVARCLRERGATPLTRIFFDRYLGELDRRATLLVPKAWEHRDFQHGNVYFRSDGTLSVVDWEGAREGLGFRDLILFVCEWLWASRSRTSQTPQYGSLVDFRKLFLDVAPSDPLVAAARFEMVAYVSAMRIDRCLVPLILADTVIRLSTKRARHQRCLEMIAEHPEGFFLKLGANALELRHS